MPWNQWSWADWVMLGGLALYAVAVGAHVRIGKRMFVDKKPYPPLSSSSWVPSRENPRQILLLGMFHVAVPLWIAHIVALLLVLVLAPGSARYAGVVAAVSTFAQAIVVLRNVGTKRRPGKVLVGHYVLQTLVALTWAVHAWCAACPRGDA